MAVAAAAALLDELMGRSRNDAGNSTKKVVRWQDPEYCKYYMVLFCPHDLFTNTRADLGPCSKIHCEEARQQYLKAEGYMKTQYEDDFMRFAQSMLNEVDRKIIKGEQRLALMGKAAESQGQQQLSTAQTEKNEEQITLLTQKINSLVDEAEQLGINGNVEQAQGLMKLCDQLKEERETLCKSNENSQWSATAELAASQEKQMEVCKVCGAFLIVGDAQSRIDDHLMGKQHTGYGRLKWAIEEIQKNRKEEKEKSVKRREEEDQARRTDYNSRHSRGSTRHSERSRSPRGNDKDKDREKERDVDKEGHKERERPRDHERNQEKRKDRNPERDRDDHNGARYKSRHHHYEKEKERDRDRRKSKDLENCNEKERDRHRGDVDHAKSRNRDGKDFEKERSNHSSRGGSRRRDSDKRRNERRSRSRDKYRDSNRDKGMNGDHKDRDRRRK